MGRHEVSVGNLIIGGITGSTTMLTTIVSLDPIWLTFNVSEGDGMTYKRLVQKGEIESARSQDEMAELASYACTGPGFCFALLGPGMLGAGAYQLSRRRPVRG